MWSSFFPLHFLVLLVATSFHAIDAEVVDLTDATFEHQTQASTGATTGSWLVVFTAPMCQSCKSIRRNLDELSTDSDLYEQGIVVGSVDAVESKQTAERFDIANAPTILYIHKKQVYRFEDDGSNDDFAPESLKEFVLEGYAQVEGSPVPGIPSPIEKFLAGLAAAQKALKEDGGSTTLVILGGAVLTLVVVLGLLVSTMMSSTTKKKKQ